MPLFMRDLSISTKQARLENCYLHSALSSAKDNSKFFLKKGKTTAPVVKGTLSVVAFHAMAILTTQDSRQCFRRQHPYGRKSVNKIDFQGCGSTILRR